MISQERLYKLVTATYHKIWSDWYGEGAGATPARIVLFEECQDSGYRSKVSLIGLWIPEGNRGDPDVEDVDGWPVWKGDLVHEMLHEYQDKRVTAAAKEAEELSTRFAGRFYGPGHDALFFTAIHEKASYFRLRISESGSGGSDNRW